MPADLAHRKVHAELRKKGKASAFVCIEDGCGRQAFDWSWVHGTDQSDLANYVPRCRSCHGWYDQSRLTQDQMFVIAKRFDEPSRKLGAEYGVDKNTIKRVWKRYGLTKD